MQIFNTFFPKYLRVALRLNKQSNPLHLRKFYLFAFNYIMPFMLIYLIHKFIKFVIYLLTDKYTITKDICPQA